MQEIVTVVSLVVSLLAHWRIGRSKATAPAVVASAAVPSKPVPSTDNMDKAREWYRAQIKKTLDGI